MKRNRISDIRRLEHIKSAIESIRLFVAEVDQAGFIDDPQIQSAVLYQF